MKGRGRPGFTLIEIMIVLVIIGVMTAMVVPRISLYFESPATLLQRSVEEAGEMALSGVSVRFVWKPAAGALRGEISVEALMKRETEQSALSAFLGTAASGPEVLEWRPARLRYPPTGEGWRMEPDIIYFYTDGSCTPAKISWAGPDAQEKDAEVFLLTVTGYCVELPEQQGGWL